MSVATRNPFALLNDDEGVSPSPPPAPSAVPTPAPRKEAPKKTGPASRGGKYYSRGGPPNRSAPREDTTPAEDSAPKERVDRGSRGGERSRGRGRGRGRDGERRGGGGGRQFDRHSATGQVDTDKRIHQSWGGDDGKTELRNESAAALDAVAEAAPASNDWGAAPDDGGATNDWGAVAADTEDWGAPAATDEAVADTNGAVTESRRKRDDDEPDNTLTLDEYLAKKTTLDLVPKLDTRKANDGQDGIWKDAIELKKEATETEYYAGKTKAPPKARPRKEEKVHIEINAHFERPSRGGRGGRGGDRGRGDRGYRGDRGGGRGRGRGEYDSWGSRQAANVDVDDQSAFPSLGA